jgi:cytochrome bd-type quinol oxidase subunit 1
MLRSVGLPELVHVLIVSFAICLIYVAGVYVYNNSRKPEARKLKFSTGLLPAFVVGIAVVILRIALSGRG